MAQTSLLMKNPHAVLAFGFRQLLQMAVVPVPGVAVTAAMVTVDDPFPGTGKE